MRRQVLEAIAAAQSRDHEKVQAIFKRKKDAGESSGASAEEMRAAGCELVDLHQWKTIYFDYDQDNDPQDRKMPSIVIYALTTADKQYNETHLKNVVNEIATLLEKENIKLPPPTTIPRYSAPVISESKGKIEGMYVVQGDGDWKRWLEKQGRLDEIYDPARNYGLERGNSLTFA